MTLNEFKAWFEGFSEMMEAAPTEDQWKRIKTRVAEINGAPTSYPVYIDRYVAPYRRYWGDLNVVSWNASDNTMPLSNMQQAQFPVVNMADAGRAEYKATYAA